MEKFSVVIFILIVLVGLSALIRKIRLPHPVILVLAGLAIGFIPVLPDLELDPAVVFIIFLPPLLYDAAFRTSWPDFKADIRPISALAVSLVFFTTVAIAVAVHFFIPGFSWPLSFLLGAIISPPDAVAAAGIIKGLGLNKRVITILEGESLLNDASALIAYRYALIAVSTGNFIFWQAGLQFLVVAGGGILIGVIIGYLLVRIHKKINENSVVETSLTLLTPFLSYLAAEQLHTSGILSVVSTGLLISWRAPEIFSYQTRLQARVVWDTLMFLLNGFVFILIGMQMPGILNQLTDYTVLELITYGAIISLVTIVVRFIWVFSGAYSTRIFRNKQIKPPLQAARHHDETTWKNVLIISWTGTRGIISLAAALAIPLTLSDGSRFPQRPMILFLCFVVILITLIVQGLSLKPLIRLLGVKTVPNDDRGTQELQLYIAHYTLLFVEEEFSTGADRNFKEQFKHKYEHIIEQLSADLNTQPDNEDGRDNTTVQSLQAAEQAQRKINEFQRKLLLKLHKEGSFSDSSLKQVERMMDINDLQSAESSGAKT